MNIVVTTIFTIIFVYTSQISVSQTIMINDCETNSPIAYAHVINLNTDAKAISNEEGQFFASYLARADSIKISHISFGDTILAAKDFLDNKIVCLKQIEKVLDEVVVTPDNIYKFLLKTLNKTEEKLINPIKLNTYYKEFIKNNESYIRFCDADVTYYLKEDRKKNFKIIGAVHNSRAYEIPSKEADEIDFEIISPIGYQEALKYYKPSNIGRFIAKEASEKYDYDLSEYPESYVVDINPKMDDDGLYKGKVFINKYDSAITSITFSIPESRAYLCKEMNAIVAKVKITSNIGYLNYSYTKDGKLFLSHSRLEYTLSVTNKNTDDLISFISDINAYEIPRNQDEIPKSNLYKKKSIYKRGTDYTSDYWLEKNLLTLTETEKKVIQSFSN
jgi:hypothetical protein